MSHVHVLYCIHSHTIEIAVADTAASGSPDPYIEGSAHAEQVLRLYQPETEQVEAEMDWSWHPEFEFKMVSRVVAARVGRSFKSIPHDMLRPHLIPPRCKPSGLAESNLRSTLGYITGSASDGGVPYLQSCASRLRWPSWFSVCYSPA